MKRRYFGRSWRLLVLVAVVCTSLDPRQVSAQGGELTAFSPDQAAAEGRAFPSEQGKRAGPEPRGELPPLPPNPAEWVCQDPASVVGPAAIDAWCSANVERGLPAAAALRIPPPLANLLAKDVFDVAFQSFLRSRVYDTVLGWKHDLNWRLTGPYVGAIGSGLSLGVHPAVRVYYSPEMIDWLCSDRTAAIPDGAAIIKEMHAIDASLGIALDANGCMQIQADVSPSSWAVMIKNSTASQDGWYWANYAAAPQPPVAASEVGNPPILDRSAITSTDFYGGSPHPTEPNPLWFPTGYVYESSTKMPDVVYPYNQYGNYCLNCHASAESELTFVSLDNVLGPGLRYKQFGPSGAIVPTPEELGVKNLLHAPPIIALLHPDTPNAGAFVSPFAQPRAQPTPEFLDFYDQLDEVTFAQAWKERLPAETYDHIVSAAGGPAQFLTSDQCMGCHDATYSNATLPNMILKGQQQDGSTQLINLSPYAEWRASPMGLAGRDPIFFSQLQSETNNLPMHSACIENTCLHCHGVMGQRQLAIDTAGQDDQGCKALFAVTPPPEVPFGTPFRRGMVTQWPGGVNDAAQRYGALARDGISCTVCHHIAANDLGQELSFTGNFVTGPANELYGPYEDATIVPKPMQHALGITPQFADQITSSDLCGSCHNILLPVFDNAGNLLGAKYEQTTHLEWSNSDFAPGRSSPQSCQDCHMPPQFKGTPLSFQIANIESSAFAPTTNRLPNSDIALTTRDTYPRHSLHGLNLFLNEMFQQFPLLLGARQIDYMTGTATVPALITGRNSMLDMAKQETASVDIQALEKTADGKLRAVVLVANKVGHYLPSGVGFRRAFLEFLVRDAAGKVLWASGRTNDLGAILDGITDQVLPSEQPLKFPNVPFQPHYQTIESGDQVQIYQELVEGSDGSLNTSFLRRVKEVKDNRLRPKGFDPAVFAKHPSPFIQQLAELPGAERFDPYYTDPQLTGADQIEYLIPLDAETLARVDHVQVSLYNQSIPPFYLQERFRDANRGPAKKNDIQRLHHITSRLNVDAVTDDQGQPVLQNWKLLIATPQSRQLQ
jgi:hypothetical protein